jgi:hypothetical protein
VPHLLRHAAKASVRTADGLAVRLPTERAAHADEATTVLFVASLPCSSARLSELFPTIFHVPEDGSPSSRRIADLVRLVGEELAFRSGEVGSSAVVDRLSDLLLIELFRVETQRANTEGRGLGPRSRRSPGGEARH